MRCAYGGDRVGDALVLDLTMGDPEEEATDGGDILHMPRDDPASFGGVELGDDWQMPTLRFHRPWPTTLLTPSTSSAYS
jgi:hypothetical protein